MAKTLTYQQIFDRAWTHIVAQGKRAVNDEGSCLYRGENGLRCAIGALITDEAYTKDIENLTVLNIPKEVLRQSNLPTSIGGCRFLAEIQGCHDYPIDGGFIDEFKKRMREVAAEYNLRCPPV
jgi:hypothetical protein